MPQKRNSSSQSESNSLELHITQDDSANTAPSVRYTRKIGWTNPYLLSIVTAAVFRLTIVWVITVYVFSSSQSALAAAVVYTQLELLVLLYKIKSIRPTHDTDA